MIVELFWIILENFSKLWIVFAIILYISVYFIENVFDLPAQQSIQDIIVSRNIKQNTNEPMTSQASRVQLDSNNKELWKDNWILAKNRTHNEVNSGAREKRQPDVKQLNIQKIPDYVPMYFPNTSNNTDNIRRDGNVTNENTVENLEKKVVDKLHENLDEKLKLVNELQNYKCEEDEEISGSELDNEWVLIKPKIGETLIDDLSDLSENENGDEILVKTMEAEQIITSAAENPQHLDNKEKAKFDNKGVNLYVNGEKIDLDKLIYENQQHARNEVNIDNDILLLQQRIESEYQNVVVCDNNEQPTIEPNISEHDKLTLDKKIENLNQQINEEYMSFVENTDNLINEEPTVTFVYKVDDENDNLNNCSSSEGEDDLSTLPSPVKTEKTDHKSEKLEHNEPIETTINSHEDNTTLTDCKLSEVTTDLNTKETNDTMIVDSELATLPDSLVFIERNNTPKPSERLINLHKDVSTTLSSELDINAKDTKTEQDIDIAIIKNEELTPDTSVTIINSKAPQPRERLKSLHKDLPTILSPELNVNAVDPISKKDNDFIAAINNNETPNSTERLHEEIPTTLNSELTENSNDLKINKNDESIITEKSTIPDTSEIIINKNIPKLSEKSTELPEIATDPKTIIDNELIIIESKNPTTSDTSIIISEEETPNTSEKTNNLLKDVSTTFKSEFITCTTKVTSDFIKNETLHNISKEDDSYNNDYNETENKKGGEIAPPIVLAAHPKVIKGMQELVNLDMPVPYTATSYILDTEIIEVNSKSTPNTEFLKVETQAENTGANFMVLPSTPVDITKCVLPEVCNLSDVNKILNDKTVFTEEDSLKVKLEEKTKNNDNLPSDSDTINDIKSSQQSFSEEKIPMELQPQIGEKNKKTVKTELFLPNLDTDGSINNKDMNISGYESILNYLRQKK